MYTYISSHGRVDNGILGRKCVYININTYIYIYIYIYIYMCVCVCACVYIYIMAYTPISKPDASRF